MKDAIEFAAEYFDGKSSRRVPVQVRVAGGSLYLVGSGVTRPLPASSVVIKPRVGDTPQRLELPDGGLLLTRAFDEVNAAFGVAPMQTLAHRLESNLHFVFVSMIALVILFWAGYRYGLPWAAREIAVHVPLSLEAVLADEALKSLDAFATAKSRLAPEHRNSLTERFQRLRDDAALPSSVRLEFRDGGFIGPNALALPGGVVVVTDQLVNIMKTDDLVIATLAHELGHVARRHSIRTVLQGSITALVSMAVFGDATSIAGIAVTLPTALVHSGYSREFEREADLYAYDLLRKTGQPPANLGLALATLQSAHDHEDRQAASGEEPASPRRRGSVDMGYFSTHPATEERIRAAQAAGDGR